MNISANLDISQLNEAELIAMAIAGLLILFAGYKIKKIGFFIMWFIIGFRIMGYLMPIINNAVPDIAHNELWQNLLPLAGGLLLALIGFSVEKVCLGGAVFGLTIVIAGQYFGTEMQTMLIAGVVGVILAGAAVMLMKPAIILATAIAGAYTIALCILKLAPDINGETFFFPMIVGIAALGAGTQFVTARGE